jgi:glycosyltransferase involved in cell wall biosynthesis
MVEKVFQAAREFDLIHFHIDHLHLPLARRHPGPVLSTFHGRLDIPDLPRLYKEFRELPFTSISNSQRKPLSWLNWQGTVYHGLNPNVFSFRPKPGEYLAFLGRICEDKGIEHAIIIAKKFGMKLKIAAKVSDVDQKFFEEKIEPLIDDPLVEFIGEINEEQKDDFLGNAYATLFPIVWPEPFGIVMIESMACGTPVIAFPNGSVPEVMVDGESGYIVTNVDAAVDALKKLQSFDRQLCRNVFDERYTSRRMASDYLKIYDRLVDNAKQTAA